MSVLGIFNRGMMNDHLTKNMIDYMTEITRLFPQYGNKESASFPPPPRAGTSNLRPILASTSSYTPNASLSQWNTPKRSSTPIPTSNLPHWSSSINNPIDIQTPPYRLEERNDYKIAPKTSPETNVLFDRNWSRSCDISPMASFERDNPFHFQNRENIPPMSGAQNYYPAHEPMKSFSPRGNVHYKQNFRPRIPYSNTSPPSPSCCSFCKKNGETLAYYSSHALKAKIDGKIVVTCPVLRSLVCSVCGATEGNAHTLTYCPMLRSRNQGFPLQSTTIALKNTKMKSNGRRRF